MRGSVGSSFLLHLLAIVLNDLLASSSDRLVNFIRCRGILRKTGGDSNITDAYWRPNRLHKNCFCVTSHFFGGLKCVTKNSVIRDIKLDQKWQDSRHNLITKQKPCTKVLKIQKLSTFDCFSPLKRCQIHSFEATKMACTKKINTS